MKLEVIKVSPIGVQTDVVVPAVPVVIEGALRASYASLATQVSIEIAALAPISPVLSAIKAQPLVVHGVFC